MGKAACQRRCYAAAALTLLLACGGTSAARDAGEIPSDAGEPDAGIIDAGMNDAGSVDAGPIDAGEMDAGTLDAGEADAGSDAGTEIACAYGGEPGVCMLVSDCASIANHSSEANECPGPADFQCCVETPGTANNPPVPAGWKLMEQSQVTPAMTDWAVEILDDPAGYPMFSTAMMTFGSLQVLARVEWHPPDFQNSIVHRGVTLYVPQ